MWETKVISIDILKGLNERMASNKSVSWYIENDDFEGAVERLETTSARWKATWYNACAEIYKRTKKWVDKYILDPIAKAVKRIEIVAKSFAPRVRTDGIRIADDCPKWNNEQGVEKCYLIEFFDADGDFVCSKVGTTTRTVQQRIREELKSTTYQNMGAESCVIHRVYDCKKIPAEGVESLFRAEYIKRFPESFKKNDRFINARFDFAEADKIFNRYISDAVVA